MSQTNYLTHQLLSQFSTQVKEEIIPCVRT